MQFFSMLFYFQKENEINKISSQVSFKLFCRILIKGVFRTQPNIYNGVLLAKNSYVNCFCEKTPL